MCQGMDVQGLGLPCVGAVLMYLITPEKKKKKKCSLCWLVRVEPIHIFWASTWMLHASPQITEKLLVVFVFSGVAERCSCGRLSDKERQNYGPHTHWRRFLQNLALQMALKITERQIIITTLWYCWQSQGTKWLSQAASSHGLIINAHGGEESGHCPWLLGWIIS